MEQAREVEVRHLYRSYAGWEGDIGTRLKYVFWLVSGSGRIRRIARRE
jgi:hypothetical protein